MRHGSRRDDALLCQRDGGGLGLADPYREEPLADRLLEQHDRLVARQLDPDAGKGHLDHGYERMYPRPPGPATERAAPGGHHDVGSGSPSTNGSSRSGSSLTAFTSAIERMSGTLR